MDKAISCQVIGGSSSSGSTVVEALDSRGVSATPSFGLMGMTLVFAFHVTAFGGGGKGVSAPLWGA